MSSQWLVLVLVLVLVVVGCGQAPAELPAPVRDDPFSQSPFVAFAADFAEYPAWDSVRVDDGESQGGVHVAGASTIFINRRPAAGLAAFPVGTMLVKQMGSGQIFAMAKRGGHFNVDGAVDWEWFELLREPNGVLTLKWRGVGPPSGEGYGGEEAGSCNQCHTGAWENDFVRDELLLLSP